MNRLVYILLSLFGLALLSSCTSARWTVKDKDSVDKSEYEIIEQDRFLRPIGEVSPQEPILNFRLYSKNTYRYQQRVLMERNIQDYKLRPGFLALGLAGAAASFYAANAGILKGSTSSTKSVALNAAGVIFGAAGFLNMRPAGDPRPTGEQRYLRSTGDTVRVDTVQANPSDNRSASISLLYNDQVILKDGNRSLKGGTLDIPLAGKLNELELSGPNPGSINVLITFEDSTHRYNYPVEQILQPYARITSNLAELRNSPELTDDNILADLVQGSQLKIQNMENENWFRVLYGISENFVRKEDAEMIWRSSDFAENSEIVTVPRVPFGDIDVENNIPILKGENPNGIALIVTNEQYSGNLPERDFTHRDGQLMKIYLQSALGYPEANIYEIQDFTDANELNQALSTIRFDANSNSELFVYLGGFGTADSLESGIILQMLGTAEEGKERPKVNIRQFLEQLASISSSKTTVVSDIDFSQTIPSDRFSSNEAQLIIESNASPLQKDNAPATFLMSSGLNYPSSLYFSSGSVDKKHHIFPYYFAKALQNRMTNMSRIYQYLERNVSYIARKLFDRPQDPILIGNTSLDLVSE